jgi:hypothetical protein
MRTPSAVAVLFLAGAVAAALWWPQTPPAVGRKNHRLACLRSRP